MGSRERGALVLLSALLGSTARAHAADQNTIELPFQAGAYSASILNPGGSERWIPPGWAWTRADAVPTSLATLQCRRCSLPGASTPQWIADCQTSDPAPNPAPLVNVSSVSTTRIQGMVADGKAAGRFTVVDGSQDAPQGVNNRTYNFSNGLCTDWYNNVVERSELIWNPPAGWQVENDDVWYRWWTLLRSPPASDAFPFVRENSYGQFQIIAQFKVLTGGVIEGGPPISVTLVPNDLPRDPQGYRNEQYAGAYVRLDFPGGSPGARLGNVVRDRWVEFLLHVHWSNDSSSGFIEAWYDGSPALPKTFSATLGGGTQMYVKHGLYRNHDSSTAVVYHSDMKVSRTDPRTLLVLLPVATPTGRVFIPVEL